MLTTLCSTLADGSCVVYDWQRGQHSKRPRTWEKRSVRNRRAVLKILKLLTLKERISLAQA